MTEKTLNKLPQCIREHLEGLRKRYNDKNFAHCKDETRVSSASYCLGLYHSGLISDCERRILFIYTTMAKDIM